MNALHGKDTCGSKDGLSVYVGVSIYACPLWCVHVNGRKVGISWKIVQSSQRKQL